MSTVTFDTQKLVNKLKSAGFAQATAEEQEFLHHSWDGLKLAQAISTFKNTKH